MGFWGMSDVGKQTRNNLVNWGNQAGQNSSDWNTRGGQAWSAGDNLNNVTQNYQYNRMNDGFTPISQIQDYGNQIMPGLDSTIAANWGRSNDQFSRAQGDQAYTQAAIDRMNANSTQAAGNIGRNQDIIQGDINNDYNANAGISNNIHGDIVGNIKDNYGSLIDNTNNAYGGLRADNAATYGGLTKDAAANFDQQQKNVEMLRPGGEFQTAQTARSYAPEVAQTAGNLRRSGIDASSPQAASIMAGAYRDRARGMDDAAANGTNNYVSAANSVASNRLLNNQNLATSRFGNESSLSQNQLNTTNQLGLGQGKDFRNEQQRYGDQQIGLNQNRTGQTVQNQDAAFNRTQDWLGQNTKDAQTERNMRYQDTSVLNNLQDQQKQQAIQDEQLKNTRYNQGLQYAANNQAEKNSGAAALQQMGQNDYNRAISSSGLGLDWGKAASNNWNQVYGNEAANAGWGSKMLLGAGLSLLTGQNQSQGANTAPRVTGSNPNDPMSGVSDNEMGSQQQSSLVNPGYNTTAANWSFTNPGYMQAPAGGYVPTQQSNPYSFAYGG